jgi:hypothetical protein
MPADASGDSSAPPIPGYFPSEILEDPDAPVSAAVPDEEEDEVESVLLAPAEAPAAKPRNALTVLPIVSDLGSALGRFVREFDLDWKLCHFHIKRAAGTRGPVGVWVRRIIRCYTIDAYIRTCETIGSELQA